MNIRNLSGILCVTALVGFLGTSNGQESSSRWGANYFPDYQLTDQYGKQSRFFSDLLKDKIVVICTPSNPGQCAVMELRG